MRRPLLAAIAIATAIPAIALADDAKKAEPKDTTLGAPAPEGAVVLLGKEKPENWVHPDGKAAGWKFADGIFTTGRGNVMTKDKFKDFQLHLEFNVPYMPEAKGQGRGNSGVYLQGRYELQVLDSYGLDPQTNDCGAIYQQIKPAVNACKPPLQWQTYDITFHSAVLEGDKVAKKARLTVVQNGIPIIEDKEIDPTPGGLDTKAGEPGPLWLQDHGNAVQFRNIWIKPLD